MFVARVTLAHAFKKTNKNVTEQLTSKSILAQISLTLWTLLVQRYLNSITSNACVY